MLCAEENGGETRRPRHPVFLVKDDKMGSWEIKIDRCFGLEDRPFAEHPSDLEVAFTMLAELREDRVIWEEFERVLRRRLARMSKLNTEEQVQRVRGFIEPWLY